MIKSRHTAIIALLSILFFIACGSNDSLNKPVEEITATILPSGGTITSEDGTWAIEFPAGAVTEPTEITVSIWPEDRKPVPEGYRSVSPVFEFTPGGIDFTAEPTLRLFYDQAGMPEDGIEERMTGFYYLNDDGSLEEAESTINTNENFLEVKLPHFSFGIGLAITVQLVNDGVITNEAVVQMIADRVVQELNSMTPEEREIFIEENRELLEAFSDRLDEILQENPLEEIINPGMVFYQDADSDGYGNPAVSVNAVTAPPGYVEDNTDCDDTNDNVNPGASEFYGDGVDNDCDGMTDETIFDEENVTNNFANEYFYCMAFGNGIFVGAGDGVGSIVWMLKTSPDGETWTPGTLSPVPSGYFNHIIRGNDKFVATAYSTDIWTSADGITWAKRTSPVSSTSFGFGSIVYHGGFYLISSGGANDYLIKSADGVNWSNITPANWGEYRLCAGNGIWLAYGFSKILKSTDGSNWTEVDTTLRNTGSMNMTFIDGKFYLSWAEHLQTSIDGETWTDVTETDWDGWYIGSIVECDDIYIAQVTYWGSSPEDGTTVVAISTDGLHWFKKIITGWSPGSYYSYLAYDSINKVLVLAGSQITRSYVKN